MTGLGAAMADGSYGLIAGFGLGTTSSDYLHATLLVCRHHPGIGLLVAAIELWRGLYPASSSESSGHALDQPWFRSDHSGFRHRCFGDYMNKKPAGRRVQ